ncbi:Acetyltransferase (GNAT) family protein [Terribacillus halophilus]|uniref:Acetyltransferase (GNAT) family protein n=1 Tax=Terribacillus halophilus TaxID=361279 RepID=A0A1G6PS17_9BACI|nr:GNAT family N-acetyltransferase [Terribacillus halophilus]SDC82953.1 Acetyltransferase (GNAT) family protein [Terribacillus halophilus]
MLWNIAVHPYHQRKGVAAMRLKKAIEELQQRGITYLEAWTREADWMCGLVQETRVSLFSCISKRW